MTKEADWIILSMEHNKNDKGGTAAGGQASEPQRREQIRALNDRLRIHVVGGRVVVTSGIAALGPETTAEILRVVADFDAFTPDNDPWDEHDCATLTVHGTRVIWKIDYYDLEQQAHSPDPADPKLTVRVLTLMLADEY
jgi:hypothetical protein